jgi:hypothetical protein
MERRLFSKEQSSVDHCKDDSVFPVRKRNSKDLKKTGIEFGQGTERECLKLRYNLTMQDCSLSEKLRKSLELKT